MELVFKVLICEVFQKVEIGYKSFSKDTDHVSEKSYLIYYPFFKQRKQRKRKAEWYDLMLLSLPNYISQGTIVQFLSSFSRALLHVEV